jgi:hypothetical protein
MIALSQEVPCVRTKGSLFDSQFGFIPSLISLPMPMMDKSLFGMKYLSFITTGVACISIENT